MEAIETKVYIIIPVYKAEKMLARCLDSLIAQTYTKWQAILIDDASPDKSGEIAKKYAQQDSRFCYLENDKNMGAAATRNRGMALLEDGYAAFLDSDDWWEKDTLEKMLNAAINHQADFVQCAWRINYPDGTEIAEENTFPALRVFDRSDFSDPLKKMLTGISMNHMARKIVRCDLIRDLRFNENLRTAEDLEISFHLLMRAKRIAFIPDALYHYYRHGNSLTGNGLSFSQKWHDNRAVSTIMLRTLRQTEFNGLRYRLMAWFRPYSIIIDKAKRIYRDHRALK